MVKICKTIGTYKYYKKTSQIWTDSFHNYSITLFAKALPDLHSVLATDYRQVFQFSQIYEWQEAVLPLAIDLAPILLPPLPATLWIS